MRPQRRGRSIAMSADELDRFLGAQRTARVASVGLDGQPHVVPLWFVWVDQQIWLNSLVRSQRWTDVVRNPAIAVVVDAGEEYSELCGVQILGTAEVIGEIPRRGESDARLVPVERAFAMKYSNTDTYSPDGAHAWLAIAATKVASWDFRKLAER